MMYIISVFPDIFNQLLIFRHIAVFWVTIVKTIMLQRSQGFYSGAWCAAALCLVEERVTVSVPPVRMWCMSFWQTTMKATARPQSAETKASNRSQSSSCDTSAVSHCFTLFALFKHHLGVHLLGTKNEVSFEFEMLHLWSILFSS